MSRGSMKVKGLSKSIISHSFRGRQRQSRILLASHQHQRKEAIDASRQADVQGMFYNSYSISSNLAPHAPRDVERGSSGGGEHDG